MPEAHPLASQARYLAEVLLAVSLLALQVAVALRLWDAVAIATARQGVVACLALVVLAQVQLVRGPYRRADELRKFIHRRVGARTRVWLAICFDNARSGAELDLACRSHGQTLNDQVAQIVADGLVAA